MFVLFEFDLFLYYDLERRINDDRYVVVGVNRHLEGNDEAPPETLYIDPAVEDLQRKRLATVRAARDGAAVDASLAAVRNAAADPTVNVMGPLVEAVRAHASLGELVGALGDVFGWWDEAPAL